MDILLSPEICMCVHSIKHTCVLPQALHCNHTLWLLLVEPEGKPAVFTVVSNVVSGMCDVDVN